MGGFLQFIYERPFGRRQPNVISTIFSSNGGCEGSCEWMAAQPTISDVNETNEKIKSCRNSRRAQISTAGSLKLDYRNAAELLMRRFLKPEIWTCTEKRETTKTLKKYRFDDQPNSAPFRSEC
ncbi:hypothetical protein Zmor_008029 [Zophobas morio]|uniref:Uncharacterized protein n=1 Tax=Zophobas morio TaxID=2755281 RepID=A0AA38J0J9_9CUCU|nr:hypothetical protein Zmor_008029 [Zophobas morio]